jgi:hypothetical protein
MESDRDTDAALAVIERAGAAPYVDYPPTPKWYPFAAGAWAGLLVLALHGLTTRPLVFAPLLAALLLAEGAFLTWYRRYRQTMPSLHNAPREIAAAIRRFFAGCVVVLALCVSVYVAFGALAAALVTLALVTGGLARYEHSYARAAAATRRRLRFEW